MWVSLPPSGHAREQAVQKKAEKRRKRRALEAREERRRRRRSKKEEQINPWNFFFLPVVSASSIIACVGEEGEKEFAVEEIANIDHIRRPRGPEDSQLLQPRLALQERRRKKEKKQPNEL